MAADLLDRIRDAVLRQQEQATTNYFTRVEDIRDFITDHAPTAGVELTVKLTCFSAERLTADNGTRVTLVDFLAHASVEDVREDLADLNAVNRKDFIAQVMVWDAKKRIGSPRSPPMQFRPGAVNEFKQVHNVGFYADVPKGSVQMEEGATDRVVECAALVRNRKSSREPARRAFKSRSLEMELDDDGEGAGEDNGDGGSVGSAITDTAPRTRAAAARS
ncbi:uncharacterized protein IUM83_05633 [Phytophthora cinnamomi]|uniref:uncharacterized protein n=1 Tax=Phytophthora cinnamomi TaxID=4785 RepID=UPI00355A8DA6|nr:hypothetical protein IUM83_05633 [Phytophthora cinnamomi]